MLSPAAADAPAAEVEGAVAADEAHAHTGDPGAIALFSSILALLTALAGVVLGVRASRRTVSS